MHNYKLLLAFSNLFLFLVFIRLPCAYGVVNIDTTRIVFNEEDTAKSFRLKNSASIPSVLQLWTDYGNPLSSPDTVKTPLVALPPVSKLFGKETRSYRLILTSRGMLKRDVESLFWLNVYQIPVIPESSILQDKKIVLPLRLRLKVLVRPSGVKAPRDEDYKRVKFKCKEGRLIIDNPTPWFITLSYRTEDTNMLQEALIPPKTSQIQEVMKKIHANSFLNYQILDDNGMKLNFSQRIQN